MVLDENTSNAKKDLIRALLTFYMNSNSLASNYMMLGILHDVCHELCFIVLPSFVVVCVPALHFASPVHGTAVSWPVGCYTCWLCRWSTSATTWPSARHASPCEKKPLAAPTGDSLWTLVSTLWVSVATGQSSWPWEKNVSLLQQTWCKRLLMQPWNKISLELMDAVLFISTGWQHGSFHSKLVLLAIFCLAANLRAAWTDINGLMQLLSCPDFDT